MGQGDQVRRHQAGVKPPEAQYSIIPRSANRGALMSANKHFVTSKTAGLRTLAVKTAKRSEALPDLPTVGGSPVTAPLTPNGFFARWQTLRGGFEISCQACSSSSKALASFRSWV